MSELVSYEAALGLLARSAPVRAPLTVPLEAAIGLRLAAPVTARLSRPPQAVSAMDGYGVRLADVRSPGARLNVIGEAPAGRPFDGELRAGQAVRLFTGSVIPAGADHVVIQEDATREGDTLICGRGYDEAEFVRRAGLDFTEGETLLEAGRRIGPFELSIAAAANHDRLVVQARPRVGLLANGDELRPPGSALAPGQIVNSNPVGLGALIQAWGGGAIDLGVAHDTTDSILAHMTAREDIDIFVPVGGASVGDHDLMRPAFREVGFETVFAGVAVRPGKPTWLAARGAVLALGLPGNPASALVCAHLFLKPLLAGPGSLTTLTARLEAALPAEGRRETFLRGRVHVTAQGELLARAAPNQDSSLIRPFLDANALIRRLPGAAAAAPGERVEALLIGPVTGAG